MNQVSPPEYNLQGVCTFEHWVQTISNLTSYITWTRRVQALSSLHSVTNAVLASVGRWRFGAAPKASL